ncbi:hypothetical protein [Microtetraspora malaysiensis]|uniref:hypothetical protein n=1 Tax=Microtetraspora malaysiensis TaxID=161358 RepID=UPI003D8FF4FB
MRGFIARSAATAAAAVTALALVPVSAAEATTATSQSARSYRFVVSATSGWQDTGTYLRRGDRYSVEYLRGTWTVDSARFDRVDADGYDWDTDARIYQGCKILKNEAYGTLLAKRGRSLTAMGSYRKLRAKGSGTLRLRINDADGCLGDNAGQVTVVIRVWRARSYD